MAWNFDEGESAGAHPGTWSVFGALKSRGEWDDIAEAIIARLCLRLTDLQAAEDPHVSALAAECEEVVAEIAEALFAEPRSEARRRA